MAGSLFSVCKGGFWSLVIHSPFHLAIGIEHLCSFRRWTKLRGPLAGNGAPDLDNLEDRDGQPGRQIHIQGHFHEDSAWGLHGVGTSGWSGGCFLEDAIDRMFITPLHPRFNVKS